jgi:hypothetical protein
MKKGRAGTMTHDYKRHGVTILFAAFNILEGLTGQCSSCRWRARLLSSSRFHGYATVANLPT